MRWRCSTLRLRPCSAPGEIRRPLLEEGRHALAEIVRRPGDLLQVALEVELLVERVAEAGVERLLDEAERARRLAREMAGERRRLGHQRCVVDDPPDEA